MTGNIKHHQKRVLTPEGREKLRLSGLWEWLRGVAEKHGDKFDYSRARGQFKTQKAPEVEILCVAHRHWFSTRPHTHLRGKNGGCPICDKEDAIALHREREWRKFSEWFGKNCSERLEMRSEFHGMTAPMKFYCRRHKIVSEHKPTYLFNNSNYGCGLCAKEAVGIASRLQLEEVLEELQPTLPEHVEIREIEYDALSGGSKIKIWCQHHEEQTVTKGYLARSEHKCPECGKEAVGYAGHRLAQLVSTNSQGEPTYLAVMEIEALGISAIKVGVTRRSIEARYGYHLKKILFSVQTTERTAYVLENRVHRAFRDKHDTRIIKKGMRDGTRWAGDTELYWKKHTKEIIEFLRVFFDNPQQIDFSEELKLYEVPNFFPRDKSREKDLSNQLCPIVGINPETGEILKEYPSIGSAQRAGYKGVRSALLMSGRRGLSGGLRWFKKSEYVPELVTPVPPKQYKTTPVSCLDTGEVFSSIALAVQTLRARGINITQPHVTAVCRGRRRKAGGFSWAYAHQVSNSETL